MHCMIEIRCVGEDHSDSRSLLVSSQGQSSTSFTVSLVVLNVVEFSAAGGQIGMYFVHLSLISCFVKGTL